MKAIIAINEETGEIRSGQTDGLDGFNYYILKFGDKSMPIAEIETAYYNMAIAAGIVMEECRLFPVDSINHFLTNLYLNTMPLLQPQRLRLRLTSYNRNSNADLLKTHLH